MQKIDWNDWNINASPKYPHNKVIQYCLRNFSDRQIRERTKALDWGCGSGVNTLFLRQEGFIVCGTDISREGIRNTEKRLEHTGLLSQVDLRVECLGDLSLSQNEIDLVICVGVLECVSLNEAVSAIEKVEKVMKIGAKGVFIFASLGDFRLGKESSLGLRGSSREEVDRVFGVFKKKYVDRYITTYMGGLEQQIDWLVTVEKTD